mgnify:CR=1 FL=1
MFKEKRSFFEKITGAVHFDTNQDDFSPSRELADENFIPEAPEDGHLTVDVYETNNDIVIKTMVAGVKPEDLDISITREMVTIRGKREEDRNVSAEDYFHRELYWGSFARTIMLPKEVDIEEAEAIEKYGLLILKLPKLDKNREARLKVKGM